MQCDLCVVHVCVDQLELVVKKRFVQNADCSLSERLRLHDLQLEAESSVH